QSAVPLRFARPAYFRTANCCLPTKAVSSMSADPFRSPYSYDASGRLTAVTAECRSITTFSYTSDRWNWPEDLTVEHAGAGSSQPVVIRTFEFRLVAEEQQEQSVELPQPVPTTAIVAANNIRTYLTRTGDSAAASSAIG